MKPLIDLINLSNSRPNLKPNRGFMFKVTDITRGDGLTVDTVVQITNSNKYEGKIIVNNEIAKKMRKGTNFIGNLTVNDDNEIELESFYKI